MMSVKIPSFSFIVALLWKKSFQASCQAKMPGLEAETWWRVTAIAIMAASLTGKNRK